MKNQLIKLITDLGFTASRFADEIGVQRSGISHILSGRNQPSYDFIVKIVNRFPDINLEWLLLGKGTMRKAQEKDQRAQQTSLFSLKNTRINDTSMKIDEIHKSEAEISLQDKKDIKKVDVTNVTFLENVIIFYNDGTFKQYSPAKED